jgi:hypothetical protein
MSLHRDSHHIQPGSVMAIASTVIAAIAGVQIAAGAAPGVWLVLMCAAMAALLVQASRATESSRPIRVRAERRHRAASRW